MGEWVVDPRRLDTRASLDAVCAGLERAPEAARRLTEALPGVRGSLEDCFARILEAGPLVGAGAWPGREVASARAQPIHSSRRRQISRKRLERSEAPGMPRAASTRVAATRTTTRVRSVARA